VVADFDGGMVSSDAGALLLGEADKAIGLIDRFAACFRDRRHPAYVLHDVKTLVAQRVFGLALGYEDLLDHDELRRDPVLGVLLGKLERGSEAPVPLAGKSTLNRLEHAPAEMVTGRYHKIGHDSAAIEALFVDLFLDAHRKPPREIVLDLDATDDPLAVAIRKAGSSMAITTAIATCRSTFSAAGISSPPSFGVPISTAAPVLARRRRALSAGSGRAGRK
jgi:hypothetical protein